MTADAPDSSTLPDSVGQCHEEILKLRAELAWFRRQMFGHKSERMPELAAGQGDVFGQEAALSPPQDQDSPGDGAAKRRRHKHGRRNLAECENLPIGRRIVHDVSEAHKACPCCGEAKKALPSKFSYQIGMTRPQLFRIEHEMRQYGCSRCGQANVSTAARPMELVERCMADASLLSHVAVAKFADHLPLHRLEAVLERMGIRISRWTLCNWAMRMGEQLKILADEMLRRVCGSRHAHVDETTMPVLAPGKTRTGYLWGIVGGRDAPYTLYQFTPGRGRAGPLEFLARFKGILQTDAYTVYENISKALKLTWAACWAHVRRKFVDAFKLCASAQAQHAIGMIRQLYAIERIAKPLTDDERRAMRLEKAAPVIEQFFAWCDEQQFKALPQSPVGKAVSYALNIREQLKVYLDRGYVGIDNNPVERALRPVVIGRRNWLFAGNDTGGQAAAVFYSLIESAKRHGINVADYMEDIIRRLPSHPANRIAELLPDQWKPQAAAAA